MAAVRPFRAVRPCEELAGDVIAPPYDVLDEDEARAIAALHPHSFLHVTRPEVGLPRGTMPSQRLVWERGRDNLRELIASGAMVRDAEAHYYLYAQATASHRQVGVLAAVSVDAYDQGEIRKHEYTLPEKEDDRTRHLETLDAQVGLVFLAYRKHEPLSALVEELTQHKPAWSVQTEDGVTHTMWVAPAGRNAQIQQAFEAVPVLYIADGHHRSAAASRVHALRQDESTAWFVAGLFPDEDLQVLAYHRVVGDLAGLSAEAFVEAVREAGFDVFPGTSRPASRGSYAMYVAGVWYALTPKPGLVDETDPVASLDTAVLQDKLLGPVLGIQDPRASTRIRFAGGHRSPEDLAAMVDTDGGVAFYLYPTGMDQLFAVSDSGKVMPAKSTWFEPKLREGVVVRLLDEP